MTPDQIYAIKRVLMLPPEDLLELRKNMQMHNEAITRIQSVFDGQHAYAKATEAMTQLHNEIQHRTGGPI